MSAEPEAPKGTGPVIIMSYLHSGARSVQEALADGTDLACTAGTGVLPMCETAAAAWAHIGNRRDDAMTQLAVTSIRALVNTQLTVILASAGKRRWCELVTAPPSAARTFLQIVPSARFVCVHRACTGVISAAIEAHPWGLASAAIAPFTTRYPGNSVAAVAAYWASATERMLAFEAAYPQFTIRVRYEDVIDGERGLSGVRSALALHRSTSPQSSPEIPAQAGSAGAEQRSGYLQVPVEMIPGELGQRIDGLHARLGAPESFPDQDM